MDEPVTNKVSNAKPSRARLVVLAVIGLAVIMIVAIAHHRRLVVVTQMVPTAGGVPKAQTVMPATVSGKSTMCNGREVAPTASGCTAGGGVIFASPPETLTRNGKDQ